MDHIVGCLGHPHALVEPVYSVIFECHYNNREGIVHAAGDPRCMLPCPQSLIIRAMLRPVCELMRTIQEWSDGREQRRCCGDSEGGAVRRRAQRPAGYPGPRKAASSRDEQWWTLRTRGMMRTIWWGEEGEGPWVRERSFQHHPGWSVNYERVSSMKKQRVEGRKKG